jgi:SAM-dependent methyltransferase
VKTNAEIAAWYDGFLSYMERDAKGVNPRREHMKEVLHQILQPGTIVLEPGCGIGLNSIFMARELGCKVTAVDISPKLIEAARKMHPHENIEYVCGDFADQRDTAEWRRNKYDSVVLCDVLEHIPEENLSEFIDSACLYGSKSDNPVVYVNLPAEDYQNFIMLNAPGLRQIIDTAISPDMLLRMFKGNNLRPIHMNIYGIDAPCQYQEYVLVRSETIHEQINRSLRLKK